MKHGKLHAIAHNLADSVAGGASFIFGYCPVPVFAEAAAAKDNTLVVDFLRGTVESADPKGDLAGIIPLFTNGLSEFCAKHGAEVSDFREFSVRYTAGPAGIAYAVTIEDKNGKKTSREYIGNPGRRVQDMDSLGRRRPKTDS